MRPGEGEGDVESAVRRRLRDEVPAEEGGSFAQPGQSVSRARQRDTARVRWALVPDGQGQTRCADVDPHGHRGPRGMFAGVGESFLDRAVQGTLHVARQVGDIPADVEGGDDPAVRDQAGHVRESGLRCKQGLGAGVVGPQDQDRRAELFQAGDGEGAHGAGGRPGARVRRSDLQGARLHGDQTGLVRDDVVHLSADARAFTVDRVGLEVPSFLPAQRVGFGDPVDEVPAGPVQETDRRRGPADEQDVRQVPDELLRRQQAQQAVPGGMPAVEPLLVQQFDRVPAPRR